MLKRLELIVIGKLKNKNIAELEHHYRKQLQRHIEFDIKELKARPHEPEKESDSILAALPAEPQKCLIALTPRGRSMSTEAMARWLSQLTPDRLVFCIGGAAGLEKRLEEKCYDRVSLSDLTFPHQIARLLFVEQLFRCLSWNAGHPYHRE